MIQIRSDLTTISENDTKFDETVSAIISKSGYSFSVTVIYNKHRTNKLKFLEIFGKILEAITSKILPQIICGDFNIDFFQKKRPNYDYLDSIKSNGFEIFDNNPTRVTNDKSTCIDPFIHQNIDAQNNKMLQFKIFLDHYPFLLNSSVDPVAKELTQSCCSLSFLKEPKYLRKYLFC